MINCDILLIISKLYNSWILADLSSSGDFSMAKYFKMKQNFSENFLFLMAGFLIKKLGINRRTKNFILWKNDI